MYNVQENVLATPLTLPNGTVLANRLAKAATSEHLADRRGAPTRQLAQAYRRLAHSGAGLLISGNVMVDGTALEAQRNVVIEDFRFLPELRRWAAATVGTEAKLILQLSHAGRQSMRGLALAGRQQDVVAPSAVPLDLGKWLFRKPRALSDVEVVALVERFATAARVAAAAGFDGVQLHAAHGYLLNQFLSPLVNRRDDRWGGSLENRMRFLLDVVRAIRAATPPAFILSVKLNSADFQRGGFDPDDALVVAQALECEGIDLLEVSGGTYESIAVVNGAPQRASTLAREAYFLDFADHFARELTVPLMLTGGFRAHAAMADAVSSGSVDLIGLARPITHDPTFPTKLLTDPTTLSPTTPPHVGPKLLDDLLNSAHHQQQLARLGRGARPTPTRHPYVSLLLFLLTTLRDLLLTP
ncbi:NADH:flavin oxidoreductase/NADH oxidase family protein [Amycolatopsis rhabdoformis]|uniref:NADH:flavin oxidoreductase/NADH oxidase family protein n=1 Tax=Amycolatopsis rhabdoformis TaxID=1448059 RepID=A0ABZ1HUY6_9PSEU|nr:NADH:flavin oxidoreductase/NADH oxidase family protein [Amycolatopsis rhabdoformis]WSE26157.1 NADH:flavin oxidoreductase/NADH oxidase family protein [Amycolatopsis rhabdoformis]